VAPELLILKINLIELAQTFPWVFSGCHAIQAGLADRESGCAKQMGDFRIGRLSIPSSPASEGYRRFHRKDMIAQLL
jgi:hypothetical protein